MSDETEEQIAEEEGDGFSLSIESRAETFEWQAPNGDGGFLIFPAGIEVWAAENDISLVRVSNRTGLVEYMKDLGSKWQAVDKPDKSERTSSVRSIGGKDVPD